ncbi:serine hydrolase [Robiginitalea sp. SC105]|uniref:serine hydrolase domain-containing protein n=1 Tax=Robiginitalea sp. SC105 TaxID=2762332 RepID=UPI001639ED51|nr:serine hydrolase [Robiginitalea sp. SC105]MBC2840573.1 serine hydrolase [Robiginitalea sp. SC105]
MKYLKRFWFIPVLLVLGLIWSQYPKLTMISGYAAKNMASTVFLSGRSPASVNQDDHQVPLISMASSRYDSTISGAVSSVLGMQKRTARCREGLGCYLVMGDYQVPSEEIKPRRQFAFDSLPYPLGDLKPRDTIFPEVDYAALEAGMEQAFSEPEVQRTRTVLVLYKDHVLAERYVPGFGPDTRVLGWSMTKSVLATLFGILDFQRRLDITSPTGLEEWQGDGRSRITFEHLLRMQSGLAWEEDYTRISDVTEMLFLKPDMPAIQAAKPLESEPGTAWNYSSGTSNLLSGLLRREFNTYQEYLDFPYSALIDRIGMHSMLIETDAAGNFVGSSYGWASTRDWGRFGLLYLHRGNWKGEQIFHPDWVDWVSRPTAHSGDRYGAHFWLNAGGQYPDVPRDLYMANGYQGQHVFIIPSKNLVVVRTGLAESPDFDVNAFLSQIVAAIPG